MRNANENVVAKAWYREPWPWLLMLGPTVVIIAGFYTLWLAMRTDDGLVADDYYKRGLAINQTLSRTQRASELALTARVELGTGTDRITVTVGGHATLPPVLRLRLVHPTQAVADHVIAVRAIAPGIYEGERPAAAAGRRVVMLEDLERNWRLSGEAGGTEPFVELKPQ